MPAAVKGALSPAEQRQLEGLLARSQMAVLRGSGPPPAKVGSKYQALTNLSVPRVLGDQTDLVATGETVTLTDEEAAHFMGTCGDQEHALRKQRPMIRAVADSGEPLPKVTGLYVSGQIRRPPTQPPPGYDGPRPDPQGSSKIQILQEVGDGIAELTDPQPGTEDALDLPPGYRAGV